MRAARVGRRRGARAGRLRARAARRPRAAAAAASAPRVRQYREALAGRARATRPPRPGWPRPTSRAGASPPAIARLQRVVDRLPLPELRHRPGRGAGRRRAGAPPRRRLRARARRDACCSSAAGVNADVELALFEADHGSPRRAVALGRRAWAAAPSVRSADALGWALHRAGHSRAALGWARRALALGSRDPAFLTHAGLIARGAGRAAAWRPRWLARRARRARRAAAPACGRRCDEAPARSLARGARRCSRCAAPRRGAHPLGNFSVNHLDRRARLAATASTCATCSTRPRSRPSRSAGCRRRACSRASAPRSRAA